MKISNLFFHLPIAYLFLMSSAFAATVIVEVRNIETTGEMHLAIYDDADVFENDNGEKGGAAKGIIDGVIEEVGTGTALILSSYQMALMPSAYLLMLITITRWIETSLAYQKSNMGSAMMPKVDLAHRHLKTHLSLFPVMNLKINL